MFGATIAVPSIVSLLQSCKDEDRRVWEPELFTEKEAKTVSALVDTILPRTETPGALDVNADIFIDRIVARTYDTEAQKYLQDEIAQFNAGAETIYGEPFFDLDETRRAEILKVAEKKSGKFSPGIWGTSVGEQEPIGFYRSFKSMAIWAYLTSEEIGKNVLAYDPIPGNYDGCVPVSENTMRSSL